MSQFLKVSALHIRFFVKHLGECSRHSQTFDYRYVCVYNMYVAGMLLNLPHTWCSHIIYSCRANTFYITRFLTVKYTSCSKAGFSASTRSGLRTWASTTRVWRSGAARISRSHSGRFIVARYFHGKHAPTSIMSSLYFEEMFLTVSRHTGWLPADFDF